MPEIKKYIEKICFNCTHYVLAANITITNRPKGEPGPPLCLKWDKYFPDWDAWVTDPTKLKPGDRTCGEWREK